MGPLVRAPVRPCVSRAQAGTRHGRKCYLKNPPIPHLSPGLIHEGLNDPGQVAVFLPGHTLLIGSPGLLPYCTRPASVRPGLIPAYLAQGDGPENITG